MSSESVVYIGRKPMMNYCMAAMTSIQNSGDVVTLKARGSNVSRAVDVAEITRNRFLDDLAVESIDIATDELESYDGGVKNVSSINIVLKQR